MKPNTVLFAAAYIDKEPVIWEAREYIKRQKYTQEQVKIADRDGVIVVVVK